MTKFQLLRELEKIRDFLSTLKNYDTNGIIFINLESFYMFIENQLGVGCELRKTVKSITPYIPLTVSDDNLRLFIEAAVHNDNEAIAEMENAFLESSMARLINSIYGAIGDEESWQEIVSVCMKIFEYKQEGVPLNGVTDTLAFSGITTP
ncbi:MAG: hypothetical protein LBM16_03785 [Clostridiales bacterium]|jgi:hypothetical protein|nr:hypothetical protein [Clostridiales bacterium]